VIKGTAEGAPLQPSSVGASAALSQHPSTAATQKALRVQPGLDAATMSGEAKLQTGDDMIIARLGCAVQSADEGEHGHS
jgi:hypothetical protein